MNVLNKQLNISKGLLEKLKELYPDVLPPVGTDIETLRYLQGQQSVVRKLEELFEDTFEEK